MERRTSAYAVAALVLLAIGVGLVRECANGPAVSEPLALRPATLSTAPPPKRSSTPKRPALIAPRLLNLDELQVNIRKYYPEAEHAAGKEGHVMMALVVGADGSVTDVRVETSGGPAFDEAAKKVVLAMRFSSATKAGKPVAVELSEGIDFQFDGAR